MATSHVPLAVVVTADDFGIGLKTSEGIIDAHLNGPVTATSLMTVTEEHVRQSIPLLEKTPNLDVGLHLVLTNCGHRPMVAKRCSGLVNRDGFFQSNGGLWLKSFAGRLSRSAIAEEIAAQAELFRALLGRSPAYVDCHHHAHQLPIVRDALVEVIANRLLPAITRTTIEPPAVWQNVPGVRPKRLAAGFIGRQANNLFASKQIRSNDFFVGMLSPEDLKNEFPWRDFLANLPQSGVIEWVVHPGLPDETLVGRDDYTAQRAGELKSMTSSAGQKAWENLRPSLTRKSILFAAANRQ